MTKEIVDELNDLNIHKIILDYYFQLEHLNDNFRIMNNLLLDISKTLKELSKVVNQ